MGPDAPRPLPMPAGTHDVDSLMAITYVRIFQQRILRVFVRSSISVRYCHVSFAALYC